MVSTLLDVAQRLDRMPDVVALGGWQVGSKPVGAGYHGVAPPHRSRTRLLGTDVEVFTSSHVRSHIMMALGMAPGEPEPAEQAVLVWEGVTGGFYLVDERFEVTKTVPVLTQPGARYAFLYALADPTFPGSGAVPDLSDSGKLMALAAYGDAGRADAAMNDTVDRILALDSLYPAPKELLRDSPVHNAGVEAEVTKHTAALLGDRIFEVFSRAAKEALPPDLPLRISGGCGLNCEWNARWRNQGFFSDVFVPPCTNDSGSALGTALDALCSVEGDPHLDWSVYSGLDFVHDATPDPSRWQAGELDLAGLSHALADGALVAWVQGRWEIGPRALGNRSLLAEPCHRRTRDRLNTAKQREGYRPIAPCCRVEDLREVFDDDFPDPHMLYFRRFRRSGFDAVEHVDGTARVQTVSAATNERLHALLTAFAARTGTGMLCNTSLNVKGCGFVNHMSDLVSLCEARGIDEMVVGDTRYTRRA